MILQRLSAAAPAEGYPKVAASPLMSWAARNSSSRVNFVKPSLRIAAWAAESRSASIDIQFLKSPDRPARAFSARATGSDRKSTRLNSSHVEISYAVFCLKKKKKEQRYLCVQEKTQTTKNGI